MDNKQCIEKLGRMGVPRPSPGQPYTFFKLLTKEYKSPLYGSNSPEWKRGSVLVEGFYNSYADNPCGRGLNLLLDEPMPRSLCEDDDDPTPQQLKREMAFSSQLLKVYVMPEDVVCVPTDSRWDRTDKIRVRKLRVGGRVTYKDWLAVLLEEGVKRSARRQRLLDAKRQARRKVKTS